MPAKHKVFISFHHDNDHRAGGELYRNAFEKFFGDTIKGLETMAIHEGDIDPNWPSDKIKKKICSDYIQDTEVTVVLIGPETYTRRYIDWEISASLGTRPDGHPSGLLGLILPEHPYYMKDSIDPATLPPRLVDNLNTGYASLHHWTFTPKRIAQLIHQVSLKRKTFTFDDSRKLLGFNLDPKSRIHYGEKKYVTLTHTTV